MEDGRHRAGKSKLRPHHLPGRRPWLAAPPGGQRVDEDQPAARLVGGTGGSTGQRTAVAARIDYFDTKRLRCHDDEREPEPTRLPSEWAAFVRYATQS
jgi:hypothetical protein